MQDLGSSCNNLNLRIAPRVLSELIRSLSFIEIILLCLGICGQSVPDHVHDRSVEHEILGGICCKVRTVLEFS